MQLKRLVHCVSLFVCVLGIAWPLESAAQDGASVIEEVIVTARKREESLQDAPISIAAFSGDDLAQRNIDRVGDVADFSPNVRFNSAVPISGNNATSAIYIRGIGQNEFNLISDPGVGLYLDGVYISRGVGNLLDLLNIERVEVLRGPQGTLFGRNTIGGAVNVITKKPGDGLPGSVSFTTGHFDRLEAKVVADVPLTETLFSNISVLYQYRDGYVEGVGANVEDLGDDNSITGRAALRWVPTSEIEVNVAFDGSAMREEASPNVLIKAVETAPGPAVWNALFSGAPGICADPTNPARLSDTRCFNSQWELAPWKHGSPFNTQNTEFNDHLNEPYRSASDLDIWGATGTIEWDLNENLTFKSISAFRKVVGFWPRDEDHSPAIIIQTKNTWEQKQFSQEFQLQGTSFGDRLNWIAGAYSSHERGLHNDSVQFIDAWFRTSNKAKNESVAVFGQATFDITDTVSLTAGARWTEDKKDFTPEQVVVDAGWLTGFAFDGDHLMPFETRKIKDTDWTPMATLSYRFTPEFMTYVSYSEGFKGGGFTQRIFPAVPEIPVFEPEFVKTYEVGFKSDWLDKRLRVNAAAFHNDYTNLQLTVTDPVFGIAPVIQNAGKARIRGLELEISARLMPQLQFDTGVGYLDDKYKRVGGPGIVTPITLDDELPSASEWSLNAGLSYDFPVGDSGTLKPRIDWFYQSEVFMDATNTPELRQPGYHVVNVSVYFTDPAERWVLRGGIKNVTDEEYLVAGYDDSGFGGIIEGVYGRPREWFLTVQRNFLSDGG